MSENDYARCFTVYHGDMPQFFLRTCGHSWKHALAEYMAGSGTMMARMIKGDDEPLSDVVDHIATMVFILEHDWKNDADYIYTYNHELKFYMQTQLGPCSVDSDGTEVS